MSTVTDLLRFATLHLEDPALAALRVVHASQPIHGWLDEWCLGWARFDWVDGQAWGWDGLVNGERSFLRILPEQRAAVALLTNSSSGRAMGRSLFAELMRAAVRHSCSTTAPRGRGRRSGGPEPLRRRLRLARPAARGHRDRARPHDQE